MLSPPAAQPSPCNDPGGKTPAGRVPQPEPRVGSSRAWNARGRLPWIVLLALVLGSVYAQELHYAAPSSRPPDDFPVFYIAAKIAATRRHAPLYYVPAAHYPLRLITEQVHEPGSLWDQTARASGLGPTLHFVTPPFTALLFEPLSRLPWPQAYRVWCWLSALMLFASVYFTLRLVRAEPFVPHLAVFTAAGFAFFPYLQTQWLGQINVLVLLSWALGAYLWARHRPLASALCFAFGTLIKMTPVLVVGVFLLRRQWRWLAGYFAWNALLLGVSVWQLGLPNHLVWLHRIYPTYACGVPFAENRSLASFILALYNGAAAVHTLPESIPAFLCGLSKGINGILYLGALYLFWKKNRRSGALAYELVVMAIVSLVVSPIAWRHYFILALLPLGYLWVTLLRDGKRSFELKLLAFITLWLGLKAPEYLLLKVPLLGLLLLGAWVAVAILLFWLCLKMYPQTQTDSA